MANMSYCRFKNTYDDLKDCYENMEETDKLSESEKEYRLKLINLCFDIYYDYLDETEEE